MGIVGSGRGSFLARLDGKYERFVVLGRGFSSSFSNASTSASVTVMPWGRKDSTSSSSCRTRRSLADVVYVGICVDPDLPSRVSDCKEIFGCEGTEEAERTFGSILKNASKSPSSTASSNSSYVPLHSFCTKIPGICGFFD